MFLRLNLIQFDQKIQEKNQKKSPNKIKIGFTKPVLGKNLVTYFLTHRKSCFEAFFNKRIVNKFLLIRVTKVY